MTGPVGILLAAGSASRFGAHKLLHPLSDGRAVAVAAASSLLQALPVSIAVVRPDDQRLSDVLSRLGMQVIENPRANEGMGTSLATAINAAIEADGWLIALADMPWIQPATITALVDRLNHGASMVAPLHQGRRGHPVGFSARWKQSLQSLSSDAGARALITKQPDALELVTTDDAGVLKDIDCRQDLSF